MLCILFEKKCQQLTRRFENNCQQLKVVRLTLTSLTAIGAEIAVTAVGLDTSIERCDERERLAACDAFNKWSERVDYVGQERGVTERARARVVDQATWRAFAVFAQLSTPTNSALNCGKVQN